MTSPDASLSTTGRFTTAPVPRIATCGWLMIGVSSSEPLLPVLVIVKVPCTTEGLKATYQLAKDGIRTNVTLIFNAGQALMAARAGAFAFATGSADAAIIINLAPGAGWLLAAGADSNTVSVHQVDPATGLLTYQTKGVINVPAPICIVFVRP